MVSAACFLPSLASAQSAESKHFFSCADAVMSDRAFLIYASVAACSKVGYLHYESWLRFDASKLSHKVCLIVFHVLLA